MRLGDLGIAQTLLWVWAGRAHQGVGVEWRYLWVRPQRPLLMGGVFLFSISGELYPHHPPPVPQGLWVQMYPRLQVEAGWVGSGAQVQAGGGSGGPFWEWGAPTITTVGNWTIPFPFPPWVQ